MLASTYAESYVSGMHFDNDIDGIQHFGGHANQDADGNFYLMGNLDSKESG